MFNGAFSNNISQIQKYLDEFKPENKNDNLGGLFRIKHKNHFLLLDIDQPPKKDFQNLINLDLYLLNIFRWSKNN